MPRSLKPPFNASSYAELCRELRAFDVRVPGRTQGRKTEHTEAWVTCRFLVTIADTDLLPFPFCVEPRDKPDLVLFFPKTGRRIGVELTEAILEDQANTDAQAERECSPDIRHRYRYRVSDPPRPQDEIRTRAQGKEPIRPFMGDSVERDWVEAMLHVVQKKADKLAKLDFTKYKNNWLLIYDNLESVSLLDERVATERLNRSLFRSSGGTNPFDRIFVQRPRFIWEFSSDSKAIRHLIPESRLTGCWAKLVHKFHKLVKMVRFAVSTSRFPS